MKLYTVAILGATGAVGQEMMNILAERNFPVGKLVPLASARSAGKKITFKGEEVTIQEVCAEAFQGVDIVLGAAENDIAEKWAPAIVEAGAVFVGVTKLSIFGFWCKISICFFYSMVTNSSQRIRCTIWTCPNHIWFAKSFNNILCCDFTYIFIPINVFKFLSHSIEYTSCPFLSKALPTLRVPANSSNIFILTLQSFCTV